MFNRTNLLIVVIAIVGAGAGFLVGGYLRAPVPTASPGATTLRDGDAAPPAERPDLDGTSHSLAEWRGKLLLVNFWASWCAPCREEMPLLDRTQGELAGKGLQIVGVAVDDAASVRQFLGKLPVSYPVLIDDPARGEDLAAEYGNTRGVLPYSVLIGRDGRVLGHRFGGFTEASLQSWLTPNL